MPLPHAPQFLDVYLSELSRLRHLPVDQFDDEADRLVPIWVAVKVAPAPQASRPSRPPAADA